MRLNGVFDVVVYLVTNKINGKQYVGQTVRPVEERWKDHCRVKDENYFHRAIRKYGADNFSVEVIDTATTPEELDEKEVYWIKKLNCLFPNGYNLRDGGNVSGRGKFGVYNPKAKLIYQFRLDGSMVNGYYGVGEAERLTGYCPSSILRSLKTKTMLTGGCLWFYADEFTPELLRERIDNHSPRRKAVVCRETGEVFESLSAAARKYGTQATCVSLCCKGKAKTTAGYHWSYYEEVDSCGDPSIGDGKRCCPTGTF